MSMSVMHKSILGCLIALLFASCGIATSAQGLPPQTTSSPTAGQAQAPAAPSGEGVLDAVTATGSRKFTPAQIAEASGLKLGEAINREALQLAANRLAATGLFSSVRYRFSSQGPNVSLEFQVTDAKTLPVAFDNFPWFTDEELYKAIQQSVGLFDGTAPNDGSYVDAIGAAIQKQLDTLGVPGHVKHRVIERPIGPGLEVQYWLDGPKLTVGSVQFTDPLAEHDQRVSERLQDLIGKPFSRYYVNVFTAEQVRPIYLSQGFLKVQFGAPEARFSGNPNHPDLGHVVVIVPVTPGPRFTWNGVNWSGNTVFDAATLNRMMGLSQGQTADGLAIAAGLQKVDQEYGKKGYLDISLDSEPVYDDAKATVSYNVKVTEGGPYRMGKLVITNLSLEAEKRVRKAWLLHAGQTFDAEYFKIFLGEVVKEALAGLPVNYQHIGSFLQRDEKTGTVNVLLDFE
jgi:outer membrane protein assembly factor BamA